MARVSPSQIVSLIDQLYPQFSPGSLNRNQWLNLLIERCHGLRAIVDLVDSMPPECIVLNGSDYAAFVTCLAAIRTVLMHPKSHGHGYVVELPTLEELGNRNPVAILRDLLAKCPDDFPEPSSSELNFITDTDLRDALRIDISAVHRGLSNSEWKASTVLAGSVVEALLLWALQKRSTKDLAEAAANIYSAKRVTKKLDTKDITSPSWSLSEYTEMAAELRIIDPNTADQIRLVKGYRNLIHPGRAIRLGQSCNRGTALAAAGGMELLISNLGP